MASRLRPRWMALAIVVPAALALAFGSFPQEALRRRAETALRRATGPDSRLGRIRVVPALLQAQIEGLVVVGPGYRVDLPRGRVTFTPRALLTWGLDLRTLEVDGLRLALDLTRESATPPRSPLAPLGRVRIDRVALREATLTLRTSDGASLAVSGLTAHGAFGAGRLELTAREVLWRGTRSLSLGPVLARLDTAPGFDATLASFSLDFGLSRVSARGALLRAAAWQPDLELEGRLDLADMARRVGSDPLSGSLALSGHLDGPADKPRIALRLDGGAAWAGWSVEGLHVDGHHDAATHRTEIALTGRALGGTVEATAHVAGTRTLGRVAAKGIELARVPGTAAAGLSGQADLDLAWDGPVGAPLQLEAHARAEARSAAWSARGSGVAHGWARVGPRTLDLEWQAELTGSAPSAALAELNLTAHGTAEGRFPPRISGELQGVVSVAGANEGSRLDLSGRLDASGDQLTARLDARGDVGAFVPGARGAANFRLEASGPVRKPALSLQATADDVVWRGVKLGHLTARAVGDTRKLDLALQLPDLAAHGSGELLLGPAARLRGSARLEGTPLGPFAPLVPRSGPAPLSGRVSAGIEYDLDPRRPAGAHVTLDVSQLEVQGRGQSFRAQPFQMTLVGGRLAVEGLDLEGPGLRLSARGTAGLAAADAVDLRARLDLDLASVLGSHRGTPAAPAALQGQVHSEIAVSGSRERPRLDGSLRLQQIVARIRGLPELRLDQAEATLQGDRLNLPGFEAQLGDGSARLSGTVPFAALLRALRKGALAPAGEARIVLRWDGVPVEALGGPVSGQLTIEGGLASLREPRARLELPATHLSVEGQTFELLATTLNLDRGRLDATRVTLRGPGGDLVVTGFADLLARTVDLTGRGSLDLRALSPLLTETALGGTADVDLAVEGPLQSPRPRGSVSVRDGTLRLRTLPQAITAITGRVELTAAGARLEATGALGGGSLQVSGDVATSGSSVGDTHVTLTGRDIALSYPVGMRSRLDSKLSLTGRPGAFVLAGDVVVARGLYALDTALARALATPRLATSGGELLRGIGLDVRVRLERPLVVRSSLGSLEVVGQIAARGDLQEPLPFGRLQIRPGGKLALQGREFAVSDGALTYSGNWNPDVSLRAETLIRGQRAGPYTAQEEEYYDVKVTVDGTLEAPRLTFSSEPALSQREIVSLVVTGTTGAGPTSGADTNAWLAGGWLVGGQAGTLLADRLTHGVARTFGFDQLTVRPDLIAGETDPSARFTFGKDLGRRLGILYSAGLGGPETRFVQVEGRPGLDFVLKLQRTDAGNYTYGAGQRFRWGGARRSEAAREGRTLLTQVRLEGTGLPEGIRGPLRLAAGQRVSAWQVQEQAESLREWLRGRFYLSAEVAARLEGTVAIVSVTAGPLYGWRVEGLAHAPDLRSVVRDALFEEDALERGRARLLRPLHAQGHWRASVDTTVESAGDRRTLVFRVSPGPRYVDVSVRFTEAQALSQRELLDAAGGVARLIEDPRAAAEAVSRTYRDHHYLGVRIGAPQLKETAGRLAVDVTVAEGPEARLAAVRFEGASLLEAELLKATHLETGLPFTDAAVAKAVAAVRELYLSRGWADARLRPQLVPQGDDLALVLHVTEGERHEIREVLLSGNTRTRDGLVRRALGLRLGAPVDPRRLARAEQRLMNLGTFSRAAIVPRLDSPSTLDVQLEEAPIFSASYDLRWSQDEKLNGLVEGGLGNLFGTGLALGARQRLGGDLRETRGWLQLPVLVAGGDLTGSIFRTEQDIAKAVTQVQRGFQLQHSLHLPGTFELLTGYRFRRTITLNPNLAPIPIDIAGLDLSLVGTTRDNLLDPLRGHFLSVSLSLDPRWMGSDAPFVKGFAQLALARSSAKGSFTWAQSYQLGLARASGGEPLLFTERFLAGGANSLRGFATNEVGPRDAQGLPTGGEAVLVLNEELRYRHASGLGAAVFYDAGNVFARARDLNFDLRHALGTGLRWSSPVGLLRLDVGFPVDRQPKEKAYRIYFSLGQAF